MNVTDEVCRARCDAARYAGEVKGRADERAAVVAWLRGKAHDPTWLRAHGVQSRQGVGTLEEAADDIERSSTLDTLDAALWHMQHARDAVLREVAYLGAGMVLVEREVLERCHRGATTGFSMSSAGDAAWDDLARDLDALLKKGGV